MGNAQYRIEACDLSHRFPGCADLVLDHLSFRVGPGKIVTLLGPNGAGKTTLVRILATLIAPSAGSASICGRDVATNVGAVRKCIGLASDSQRSFYFRLTGAQNLAFFGGLAGVPARQLKARVAWAMEQVGIAPEQDTLFMRYSQGMRKRLSLARCIMAEPDVYLLDEPTAGIDTAGVQAIRRMISTLRTQGKTILMTTHDLLEADRLSDEIIVLRKGKAIASGSPAMLRESLQKRRLHIMFRKPDTVSRMPPWRDSVEALVAFLRGLDMVKRLEQQDSQLELEVKSACSITPIIAAISEAQLPVEAMQVLDLPLEDLVLHLLNNEGTHE